MGRLDIHWTGIEFVYSDTGAFCPSGDVLSIINEQAAEIERLTKRIAELEDSQWDPVGEGWEYPSDETMCMTIGRNGGTIIVTDYVTNSVTRHHLPDELRLCRWISSRNE